MDSKLDEIQRLVGEARRLGAKGTELLREASEGVRLVTRRGRPTATPEASDRLSVRCWLEGGREGRAEGPYEQADALVVAALAQAERAEEDPLAGPVSRLTPIAGGLGIDDRRYASVEPGDRVEVLGAAERAARKDRRFQPLDFTYRDRRRVRAFANSRGVALEEHDTRYEIRGALTTSTVQPVQIGGEMESRTFASIASLPFGALLAMRLDALLRPGDTIDGEVLVMMPSLAVARLFTVLAQAFTYQGFQEDTFFLRPAQGGGPVVDPRIHLVDDGTLAGGHRATSFDERGVAPVPLTLLREGRPEGRFLDARTARQLKARPTGHEEGGQLRPTNLIMRAGSRSMNHILTDLNATTFLLDDLPDLSGLNLRTGELTATVHGQVLRSNEPTGGVTHLPLKGDLLQVLNSVHDVASNTDRHGYIDAPAMLVGGFVLG